MTGSLAQLAKRSSAVARQFIPDPKELVQFGGTEAPFEEGKVNHGIYGLERLYIDRAVITPVFDCTAYCRYCFKKTRTLAGNGRRMSYDEIEAACAFIAADPRIEIVLVTGGDPLLDLGLLRRVLDGVAVIPHVRAIRIGTRNILFQPERLTEDVADLLASYHRLDFERLERSQSLAVAFSVNHADELTPEVSRAVRRLTSRGVVVRGQVTLLKGVNDNTAALIALYRSFAALAMVPYYLYHCMPVVGAAHFRTSVQRGIDLLDPLLSRTGAMAPIYVYVTPAGKHRLSPGAPLDLLMIDGRRHVRATTPYLARDFFECTGKTSLPPLHYTDAAGRIVSHYLDGED